MCAICGILNFDHSEPVNRVLIHKMTGSLRHRGPDDEGVLIDNEAGLGFRRLSIIDLSGGKQPMSNEDGSAHVVFNGEIYNYRDLAAELSTAGHIFRTRSDTETIIHAYEQYGEDCVNHLRGMFAFAIWDGRNRRLMLARDRLGIKPLYYYQNGRFLAFASEIKALLQIPSIPREVDQDAFDQYLTLRYVPGPRTMFKNIFRLQPGHTLTCDSSGVRIQSYWDLQYSESPSLSTASLVEQFRELLEESVRLRLESEVPLGVFLSGGLDSSAILAQMARLTDRSDASRIKTFSVGYEGISGSEAEENEFDYARMAAQAFGAEHHEFRLSAQGFEELIPDLVWHLDEPLGDPSCIPLYCIARQAREHITVVLSGEGADEILAGYAIYPKMLALEKISNVPALARIASWIQPLLPSSSARRYLRMANYPLEQRYRGVCRGFDGGFMPQLIGGSRATQSERLLQEVFGARFKAADAASPLNRMLYVDAKIWLPDDLLLKADKMTMANGLELRVPFLDHKLVEFAATLQDHQKLRGRDGKVLLRKAMRGVLPDAILDRPKKGFPVPISSWLRKPLRDLTRERLLSRDAACSQYLERSAINRVVKEHESGQVDRSQEIWMLLVFEFWHQQFISNQFMRSCVA